MSLPKMFHLSCSVGLAAVLLAAVPPGRIATADNVVGVAPPGSLNPAAGEGAFRHLQALQDIATANGGNRAAGTIGYDRSAEYVAERLREAGYAVRFEEFEFPFFEERSPPVLLARKPDGTQEPASAAEAVRTLGNSGSGEVTAPLRAVKLQLEADPPLASNSGCDAADFKDFERGAVALVRRGTCQFQVKVDNAVAAGAAGVVIMNEGNESNRTDGFSGTLSKAVPIPVVGIPYQLGRALDSAGHAAGGTVRLAVDAVTGQRPTRNVLADTAASGTGPLIFVGAHLDSVAEGPGINDNGSGSAAVLEAALQLAKAPSGIRGHLRFGFWAAEERGLLGSRHHVGALSDEERRQIAVYVNLDMVGSPNFARFVQHSANAGDGLAALVRSELMAEFRAHDLPAEERVAGRSGSDDAAFRQKEIPTVGLYTGASGAKSAEQAGVFGGVAGRPFDACYHRACDTTDNINREVLDENTRALMRALTAAATAAHAPTRKPVDLPQPEK